MIVQKTFNERITEHVVIILDLEYQQLCIIMLSLNK